MKLKSPEEILKKILYDNFLNDLRNGNVCASDTAFWFLNYQKEYEDKINELFEEWLVKKGYATEK